MYAGAPRVVASRWKVDDEATAELMKHFYRQMFQENQTPSAALKSAQIACGSKSAGSHPTIGLPLHFRASGSEAHHAEPSQILRSPLFDSIA
jgi:CHAT domain-containing protein